MKNAKKILAVLLAASTLLTMSAMLTGCGKGGANNGPEYIYVPQYVKITGDAGDGVYNMSATGDKYYFTSYNNDTASPTDITYDAADSKMEDTSSVFLCSMGLDGVAKKIDCYKQSKIPAGLQGSAYLTDYDVDAQGNICCIEEVNTYHFDLPADFSGSEDDKWQYQVQDSDTYTLIRYDATGKELFRTDLSQYSNGSYVCDLKCSENGNIYVAFEQAIVALDSTGAKLYSVETENYINNIVKLPDGRIAAMEYRDNGSAVVVLDDATKKATDLCSVTNNGNGLTTGNDEFGVCYTNGAYLYGVNTSTGEASKILNWIDSDIDSDSISGMTFNKDGQIIAVTNTYDQSTEKSTSELVILTKTKASSVAQKNILTLATQSLDYTIKDQIIKFNKTNPDYRIEVKDYSEFNTEDDYEAGLKKMKTEILSGDVPDIISMQGINSQQFAAKGLLEDLVPYINKDKELGENALMPNFMQAAAPDGKLYVASQSFSINTVMGSPALVGDKPGWTVDELLAAFAKMPDGATVFDDSTTRPDILNQCLAIDMDDYVNWDTGECNFDCDGFKKLLTFAKNFPSDIDWDTYEGSGESTATRIASGKQMLMQTSIWDFSDYQYNAATFGGKATCIGMPTENGNGNALWTDSGCAISSKCSDKDGAWQFVRTFLTEKYQEDAGYGLPTNKAAFDNRLKDAMTPQYEKDAKGNYVLDKNGNKIEMARGGYGDENGNVVNFYALSQAQADDLMNIVNSTTKLVVNDQSINDIVTEESAAFFSGAKTVDEVAKLVQSRVNIYINEQS